jgi:hypothetical protein
MTFGPKGKAVIIRVHEPSPLRAAHACMTLVFILLQNNSHEGLLNQDIRLLHCQVYVTMTSLGTLCSMMTGHH